MSSNKRIYFEAEEPYETGTNPAPLMPLQPDVEFTKIANYLEAIPIYFITAHSCLCAFDRPCYGEKRNLTFSIPPETYIVSLSQVNDAFAGSLSLDREIVTNSDALRRYLYVHDTGDLLDNPEVGSTKFSLFSGILRAISTPEEVTEYPNIAFTFNDAKETAAEKNFAGVYAIDNVGTYSGLKTLNNSNSIVPQDFSRKNFFLEDIIQEVYKTTGIHKGIFVCSGCLPICPNKKLKEAHIQDTIQKIGSIMHIANCRYNTIHPTWTKDEMRQMGREHCIPNDIAIKCLATGIDPSEVFEMHKSDLVDAENILKDLPALLADDEDRDRVRKKLRTL